MEAMNNAIDESIEVEMMFLKGHLSPPPPASQDDDELQQICQTHCELKSYLFDKIRDEPNRSPAKHRGDTRLG